MKNDTNPGSQLGAALSSEYSPPRVEFVLTPEELEREVLYAGNGGTGAPA